MNRSIISYIFYIHLSIIILIYHIHAIAYTSINLLFYLQFHSISAPPLVLSTYRLSSNKVFHQRKLMKFLLKSDPHSLPSPHSLILTPVLREGCESEAFPNYSLSLAPSWFISSSRLPLSYDFLTSYITSDSYTVITGSLLTSY